MKKNRILVTGPTGFLGEALVHELLSQAKPEELELVLLTRSLSKGKKKFARFEGVEIVKGDLTTPEIFHREKDRNRLASQLTGIVHLAALYDLQSDHTSSFLGNVVATQNLLYFASQCPNLDTFHYTSSVVVSGDFKGDYGEDDLNVDQEFKDSYSKTKAEAEFIVRTWKKGEFKKRIYRPGIVVGDSEKGKFKKVDGPYFFLEFLSSLTRKKLLINTLKYLPMPIDKEALFPIVPVDWVARVIAEGVMRPNGKEKVKCYHLVDPHMPKVSRFIQDAFDQFGFSVTILPLPESRVNSMIIEKIGLPKELLSYVYLNSTYDTRNLLRDFPMMNDCRYEDYYEKVFQYARMKFEKTSRKDEDK